MNYKYLLSQLLITMLKANIGMGIFFGLVMLMGRCVVGWQGDDGYQIYAFLIVGNLIVILNATTSIISILLDDEVV